MFQVESQNETKNVEPKIKKSENWDSSYEMVLR